MKGEYKNEISTSNIPLVVDLDGTLIHTDLLYEGIIMLLKKNVLYIFLFLGWWVKGKVYFKNRIFELIQIRSELLPYNAELLKFLKSESENGRKLILATASLQSNAVDISRVHPIFDEVYGTEKSANLKGERKRQLLINQFGEAQYDYIGNSHADLSIFASSRYSYLVNPSKSLVRKTKKISNLQRVWNGHRTTVKTYVKAIRAYQWVKNFLLFVPLITSHSFHSLHQFFQVLLAFLSFNVVASSGYLINDLMDLNADRAHPRKKFRPLAAGRISILTGSILAIILFSSGFFLAFRLGLPFTGILLFYFITSLTYSLYLKKMALYDVFILALLYSVRVFAGGIVINVSLSFWLIAFSTFIFLSLAFVKRYSELMQITGDTDLKNRGRQYFVGDLSLLQMMGIVSGFLSIIVFSLYINSAEVTELYSNPRMLWAISFLFLFWISRIWLFTVRGKMTDDPIIFTLKDLSSYIIFLMIGVILWISI